MRKTIFAFAALFLLSISGYSQLVKRNTVFERGDNVFNFGVGAGDPAYMFTGWKTAIPTISLSQEYCFIDDLLDVASVGIGGYLSFSSHKRSESFLGFDETYHVYDFVLGARGVFHYQLVKDIDTYAGGMIGFDIQSDNYPLASSKLNGSRPVGAAFVGARYYVTDKLAFNSEFGYGISIFTFGVSAKL